MTPELQAYLDTKFDIIVTNQWVMVVALFVLAAEKAAMWWYMVKLQKDQGHAVDEQHKTNRKLDEGTTTITQKVEEVPQKVAIIAAEVAAHRAVTDSAGDGDLRRPDLPGIGG